MVLFLLMFAVSIAFIVLYFTQTPTISEDKDEGE